ncbi:MAG: preprotein translocase subunit SecE [Pirellulales bacterium]
MKNGNTAARGELWRDLFSLGLYKRSQGRIARQVTFAVLAVAVALGAWSLYEFLTDKAPRSVQYASASVLCVVGLWVAFRVVNLPRFADFLIAVEAEMNKVSWPSRSELARSAMVVMVTMFGLAAVLYAYDLVWQTLLTALGILRRG